MKRVPVGDTFAFVDDDDYERVVAAGPWHLHRDARTVYARAYKSADRKRVFMHNLIMDHREIDHRDRDGLNNRRSNLRLASRSNNCANKPKARGIYASRFKGVTWDKDQYLWRVRIGVRGKRVHVGRFESERDAARAYNEAAKRFFGEFACLNKGV